MDGFRTIILAALVWSAAFSGAHTLRAQTGSKSPALEAARSFTNRLARGTATERIAAVNALARLAREGWDQPSFTVALDALLHAIGDADTNVLASARRAWNGFHTGFPPQPPPFPLELLPSWTSNLVTGCALRGLASTQPAVRCAAGRALLSRDAQQPAAAAALLACLNDRDPATRRDALSALAALALRDTALATNLEAKLRKQLGAPEPQIQLRGIEGLWKLGVTREASGDRADAEEKLAQLLTSEDTTIQALAARWAMNSLYGQRTITEPLRQALIKTIERGDPEAALCAGWAAQRLLPGEPTPELSAKRRAAFNRGIRDARPEVRCSALDSLRTEADTTWWAVIKEVPEPAATSGTSSILTSRPVINRRMVRSTAQPEILSGLTNALADPDLGVRLRATRAVIWLEDLRRDCDVVMQRDLSDGLEAKDPESLRLALGLFSDRGWMAGQLRLLSRFRELALSPDNMLRHLAYESLWSVPATGSPDFWEPLCLSRDPTIRASGAHLLDAQASAQNWSTNTTRWRSIPKPVDALVRDPFPQVALAGIGVLRSLTYSTNQTPVRARAVETLTRLATDPDRFVRARLAQCLAFGGAGSAPSPTERPLLLTLTRDSDPVVRRLAACSLRHDAEGLPAELRSDPDPEVQRIALLPAPQRPGSVLNYGPLARRSDLASLTQGLKNSDPSVRRKAALELVNEVVVTRKEGLQEEVFGALLECYGGDSVEEVRRLNLAFTQLAFGPQRDTRTHRLCLMCLAEIPKSDGLKRQGLWGLLADTCRTLGQARPQALSGPDAEAIIPLLLEGTRSPDTFIRIPAVQCLQPLSAALEGSTKPEARGLGVQARTALVRALKDDQPGAVVAAAAGVIDGSVADNPDPRLMLPEEPLRDEAMRNLTEQLGTSVPAVRQRVALSLGLLASWKPDPELAQRAIRLIGSNSVDSIRPGYGPDRLAFTTLSLLPPSDPGPVLVRIALEAPEARCRQYAFEALLAMLDDRGRMRDGRLSALLSELQRRGQRVGQAPGDVQPLVQGLLGLSSGPDPTAASAWATLKTLAEGNTVARGAVTDWIQSRSKSAEAKQRQEAMDRLADLLQTTPLVGRVESAAALAAPLLTDPDSNVRASAAKALAAAQRNSNSPMATDGADAQALAKRLLDLSVGDDPAAADACISLGRLMAGSEPVRQSVAEWFGTRTRSADPKERQAAVDWLGRVLSVVLNDPLCGVARKVAVDLGADPDPGVRIAVLRLLTRAFQSNPPVTAEEGRMLLSALKSDNPQVRQAVAVAVAAGFNDGLARELVQGAAREIVNAIPQLETHSVAQQKLHQLLAQAGDNELPRKAVAAIRERLVQLDNDADRAAWLTTVGEIELARNQPEAAVTAFQQASRLTPDRNGGIRSRLDKALWAAGRGNEALAADKPPRLNVMEVEERVRVLAQSGDAAKILRFLDQALDGLVPIYGSQRLPRGFGEPDMIIGRVFPLLVSMNQPALCEQFISDALKRFPENATALQQLAKWRVQQGRLDDALALYERELLANPWDGTGLHAFRELCRKADKGSRFEALCDKLIQLSPTEPGANRGLTFYYTEQGKTNEAKQLVAKYQQAIEHPLPSEPGDPGPTWRQAALADMLEAIGDYDGAIMSQRKAVELQKGNPDFEKQRLADLLRRAGKTNELARMEAGNPKVRLQTLQEQVQSQVRSGKLDEALATARSILALDLPADEKRIAWFNLPDIFGREQGRLAPLFEEVLRKNPKDVDVLRVLSGISRTRSDFNQAAEYAERVCVLTPDDGEALSMLASACYQAGRYSRTLELVAEALRRGVQLQPPAWLLFVQPYPALGKTNLIQDITALLKTRAEKSSGDEQADALRTLAYIESLFGHHEEAARLIRRLRADPRSESSNDRPFLVRQYRLLGKLDEAIELCRQPTAQRAQYPSRQSDLCRLYQLKGMTNEAAAAFQAQYAAWLERIKSGQADAGDYNYLAWAYLQNRVLPAEALDLARKAAALEPNDANIGDTLAWALMRNGEFTDALGRFVSALTNRPVSLAVKESAWNAVFELAGTSVPETIWTPSMRELEEALKGELADLARLSLIRSRFHAQRGETDKATACWRASGYPKESAWRILGPFANEDGAGFAHEFIPEGQAQVDLEAAYPTSVGPLRWKKLADEVSGGVVYLHALFPGLDWAVAYLALTIESDRPQQVQLRLGSDDQAKLWLNGNLVFGNPEGRPLVRDQNIVPVELRQGANQLLVKVCNERGDWAFTLRLAAPGGAPPTGVNF